MTRSWLPIAAAAAAAGIGGAALGSPRDPPTGEFGPNHIWHLTEEEIGIARDEGGPPAPR